MQSLDFSSLFFRGKFIPPFLADSLFSPKARAHFGSLIWRFSSFFPGTFLLFFFCPLHTSPTRIFRKNESSALPLTPSAGKRSVYFHFGKILSICVCVLRPGLCLHLHITFPIYYVIFSSIFEINIETWFYPVVHRKSCTFGCWFPLYVRMKMFIFFIPCFANFSDRKFFTSP